MKNISSLSLLKTEKTNKLESLKIYVFLFSPSYLKNKLDIIKFFRANYNLSIKKLNTMFLPKSHKKKAFIVFNSSQDLISACISSFVK